MFCGMNRLFETDSENLLDQRLSGRKSTVERCNPHAGVTSDLIKWNVQPVLSEEVSGRSDDSAAVLLGIAA
jgi:hypothetical protein